ncbi:MAG TPA: hypothetical protein VNY84_03545 [Acidimicrobiales bacterium]|jgi:hypothetical protein|nr:hypothetical protein [Acidimicrobiales bacterium]
MFSYRVTEQMANDRLAERRAEADASRRARPAATGRRRWTILPAHRRREPALKPQFRSC